MSKFHPALFLAAALCLGASAPAWGQVTGVRFVEVPNTLNGLITCDILIDFEGQWTGSQFIIELTSGSFYRHAFGTANGAAPSPPLVAAFPGLAFDTFVDGGIPGGGAVDLGGFPVASFPNNGGTSLNQAWNPPAGVDISDQTGFRVARLTFSEDTIGTYAFLASAGGSIVTFEGILSAITHVPEPTSLTLLGLTTLGLTLRRRAG